MKNATPVSEIPTTIKKNDFELTAKKVGGYSSAYISVEAVE